jgi:hypothetical protein
MAKGQLRSNREAKKPKKNKDAPKGVPTPKGISAFAASGKPKG